MWHSHSLSDQKALFLCEDVKALYKYELMYANGILVFYR